MAYECAELATTKDRPEFVQIEKTINFIFITKIDGGNRPFYNANYRKYENTKRKPFIIKYLCQCAAARTHQTHTGTCATARTLITHTCYGHNLFFAFYPCRSDSVSVLHSSKQRNECNVRKPLRFNRARPVRFAYQTGFVHMLPSFFRWLSLWRFIVWYLFPRCARLYVCTRSRASSGAHIYRIVSRS